MKDCPHFRRAIQDAAIKCRFCGRLLGFPSTGILVRVPEMSVKAIASLVVRITWAYWIGSVLALIFGYQARNQIARSQGGLSGQGLATAGIVLGWIGIVILLGVLILSLTA